MKEATLLGVVTRDTLEEIAQGTSLETSELLPQFIMRQQFTGWCLANWVA